MARPSMAKRTSISSAINTIAWPSCSFRRRALVRVLGAINRISSDDDLVSDNLLDQWSERLEVKPERHLDGLVSDRGSDRVAAGTRRGKRAKPATRTVGHAVACCAWVGDEDPTGVGRRQLRGAGRVAAVGDGAVGARVGENLGDRMRLNRRRQDRKSTRLNSSHLGISYAVFCLKKKKQKKTRY